MPDFPSHSKQIMSALDRQGYSRERAERLDDLPTLTEIDARLSKSHGNGSWSGHVGLSD